MLRPVHLNGAAELLRRIRKGTQHPSVLASEFLQSKKRLDARDRRVISSLAFACARAALLLDAVIADAVGVDGSHAAVPPASAPGEAVACALVLGTVVDSAGRHVLEPVRALLEDVWEGWSPSDAPLAPLTTARTGGHPGAFAPDMPALLTAAVSEATGRDPLASAILVNTWRDAWHRLDEAARTCVSGKSGFTVTSTVLARRYGLPQWIVERWLTSTSHPRTPADIARLGHALLSPAPLTLRTNTHRQPREVLLRLLAEHGIPGRPGTLAPASIVLPERSRVTDLPLYDAGAFEVQDEASQLAACAVAPARGWLVRDVCAGAGGKTMHLADLMQDTGSIVASDTDARRLHALRQRASRCGYASIRTGPPGDVSEECADAVLIDAPCSGTGTQRRIPTMLARLTPRTLSRLAERQLALLAEHADSLRVGGVLVYATCSLMPEENEDVVAAFLDRHPEFVPEALHAAFDPLGIRIPALDQSAFMLTCTPDLHGTDGFFIARLRRLHAAFPPPPAAD